VSGATSRDRLASARLYAITPDAGPESIEEQVAAWLRGGVDVVQLRHKSLPRGQLLELARRVGRACADARVLFIVNDHLDIALLTDADGVHLGPDDLSVAAARKLAGPALLLGVSASTPVAGVTAEREGADYLGTGPAYETPIKTGKQAIGPAGVAAVQGAVRVPVFAIGGLDRSRLPEAIAAGVRRVCVIRALSMAADPEADARAHKSALGGQSTSSR
jgi:thiamine-phosphate pyrophosphorylase